MMSAYCQGWVSAPSRGEDCCSVARSSTDDAVDACVVARAYEIFVLWWEKPPILVALAADVAPAEAVSVGNWERDCLRSFYVPFEKPQQHSLPAEKMVGFLLWHLCQDLSRCSNKENLDAFSHRRTAWLFQTVLLQFRFGWSFNRPTAISNYRHQHGKTFSFRISLSMTVLYTTFDLLHILSRPICVL